MTRSVVVVDYGIGNLLSVTRALEFCGASVTVSYNPEMIRNAEKLLIPGVGAFADGMAELQQRSLVQPIQEYAEIGRPLLGICLGMQLLFSESDEFGCCKGLNLLDGRVEAIPNRTSTGAWRKTPHIGWNELRRPPSRSNWGGTLFEGIQEGVAAYFVHSYAVVPTDPDVRLADCDHEGLAVSAAVQKGHICGCQFHPEKSGDVGLSIVRKFLDL